jgi:hypothetical protein
MEKMTVSTLDTPRSAPMIRTRTRGTRRTVYPLRGGLSTQRTYDRTNPIEYHQRKIREIEYKMPAPILGVFEPSREVWDRMDKKRDEFVNLYRQAWGSNEGLSTERLMEMSERDLDQAIRSQRYMIEANEKRRTQ